MSTLGAFEIGRVLGTGGSGTVYAARTASMGGTEIALKVLREDTATTPRERARFMDEAGCMRRVSHPALVSLLDAGFLPDGRPYVAMPLLPGESLAARVKRGPVPLAEARVLFDDLAGAVAVLHAAGLVHRDIKPENVLVGPRNGRVAATLLDLGIARDIMAPDGTTTKLGNVRGTPAYMAMERFFGAPASVLSDVYELTVTLYVMLTGSLPWRRAEDATDRMTPAHPTQVGASLPEPLAQVLLRGLAAKPEARFASVAQLAQAVVATAGADVEQANAPTILAHRALSFAPPPAPSDPQSFESTTLAPMYPRTNGAPMQTGAQIRGGTGAALIAGGIFAGLILLGLIVGGAIYLSARPVDKGASVVPLATLAVPPEPVPPTSVAPITEPPAPSARLSTPRVAAKASATPSSAPSSAPVPDRDDLPFCEALKGIYCSTDYERIHGGNGQCFSFMGQLVGYRKMTPETRANKNKECLALSNAANMELQMAKKKGQ